MKHMNDALRTTPALPTRAPAARLATTSTREPVTRSVTPRAGLALIAAAAFGLEMAVSARYGYVRDELYFLAAGRHLAFGYVDQPALTPLIARAESVLFGNTVVGLRVVPAVGLAALVLIAAAIARQLGAGRTGQLLAALAAATCGEFIGAMHELTTTMPDFVFWAALELIVVRLIVTRDPRWWLVAGLCAGIAADAKWNIAFLVIALAAGFAVTGQRRLLASRYLVIGAVLAGVLAVPDVAWQAAHHWPNLAVFRVLQTQAWHNRATYWPGQVLFTGLALTPLWIAGLVWAWRSAAGRAFRPAALGCAIAIAVQFVLGGKPYYAGGAYVFLLAAGCTAAEAWLARQRGRRNARSKALVAAMLASCALVLPVAIPLLPAAALRTVPLQKINYDLAESIGWTREVTLIAHLYKNLPGPVRRHATILAGNYGEAGALARYGAGAGLPPAYSGANSFWLWGPPPASDVAAVAININPALLRREFTNVRRVATFRNGLGVRDDEQGAAIYLATGRKLPWREAWPAFRDYS
jgi:4-amino-4-deoxy-L-arabinose transferase-like glycosyltransferase